LFFGRYLRRSRAITVAAFFGQRFNSQRVQTIAGVTIILGLGGYLLAVTQGAAVILAGLTDLSYTQATVVAWASYTVFTMYSGSRGVVLTDTLMFLLFTSVSVVAMFYIIDGQGGWMATMDSLTRLSDKPDMMTWHGRIGADTPWSTPLDYIFWSVILGIAWSVVYAISPWQASRYLIAKNEQVVMRAAVGATIAVTALIAVLYAASVTVNLSKPDIFPHEDTMIWAAKNLMPEFLGALLLAGIMAAALSSASTFLSLVGFSASNDLFGHQDIDEQKMLRISRWLMLLIGSIALVVGLFVPPQIFWLTYFVGTLFASSWGPVAFMSVWSDRITADAAFWGIISGFAFNALPKLFHTLGWVVLPAYLDPILIGGVVSFVVVVVVSRLGAVTDKERQFRLQLHRTPDSERNAGSLRLTLAATAGLVAFGALATVLLMMLYVKPYQESTNTLQPGGGIDWAAGEAILSLSWFVLFAVFGVIAYRVVSKAYR